MPRLRLGSTALALVVLTAAVPAGAQGNSGRGYLLGTPVGSLSIRAGYDRALGGSDVFSETRRLLTVDRSDFGSMSLAADVGVRLSDRFDFVFGTAYAGSTVSSEYRDFVEQVNGQDVPIAQTTRFQRVPITGSIKAYLAPRGRSIGRLAWIPTRMSPYVGAGGGMMWYRFKQDGDFVDFARQTGNIFTSTFESDKWTMSAHAFTGLDYSVSPRLALTGEARYTWGRAPLNRDYFTGFQRIDLSGVAATAGLSVRF